MQICVPTVDRIFVGQRQKPSYLIVNRESDHEYRPDMQLGQALQFCAGYFRAIQGIGNFNNLEVAKALSQPRPIVERLSRQNFSLTLRETRARRNHRLEGHPIV